TNRIKTFFFNFVYNFIQINIISPIHIPPFSPIINTSIRFRILNWQKINLSLPKLNSTFTDYKFFKIKMNESSSSMRIIRGIPLHVNFVDNLPSFSMGLIQDFGIDVGSMVKSKQVQHEQTMEELRSMKKNDAKAVQKVLNNAKVRALKLYEEEIS
ncbi:hypothetical protein EJD97_016799, partial [Solanum chilense]